VGFLPSPANGGLFPLFCRNVGNPPAFCHSSNNFRGDLCSLLLPGSLSGELEVSALRAIIFQGGFFPELVWGQMLSLRPAEMGGLGDRNSHFNATISVWLEGRASKRL
jgi:hypothetical protein